MILSAQLYGFPRLIIVYFPEVVYDILDMCDLWLCGSIYTAIGYTELFFKWIECMYKLRISFTKSILMLNYTEE